jgi:hypothetical protein
MTEYEKKRGNRGGQLLFWLVLLLLLGLGAIWWFR